MHQYGHVPGLIFTFGLALLIEELVQFFWGRSSMAYYEPEIHLKRLVGGFIREQVVPHLKSGRSKLEDLDSIIAQTEDPDEREFLKDRTGRLDSWFQRGGVVLPLLQKILGE